MTSLRFQDEYYEGDKDQYLVKTPYGRGLVIRTRPPPVPSYSNDRSTPTCPAAALPSIKEICLLDWTSSVKSSKILSTSTNTASSTARSKGAMLYTTIDYESVDVQQGDDVVTIFGRGRVMNVVNVRIRKDLHKKSLLSQEHDENETTSYEERTLTKYQIQLTSWRLAGRSTVKCYLFPSPTIRVVRKKTLMEMTARERVDFAQRQKVSAVQVFAQKKYQQALNIYAGAVDAVRYVQYDSDSTNECRAELVEVMVTCSNNAATCCVQLQKWSDAQRYAQNALILLDALYSKRGMKIHSILTKHTPGLCDAKIFGEWRVKSYIIIAKAYGEKEDYHEAIETLKKAKDIISLYTTNVETDSLALTLSSSTMQESVAKLHSQDREIQKLTSTFMLKKKELLKKEKARAQAMFATSSSNGVANPKTAEKNASLDMTVQETDDDEYDDDVVVCRERTFPVPSPSPSPTTPPSALKPSIKGHVSKLSKENSPLSSTSNPKPEAKPNTLSKKVSFADELEETHVLSHYPESTWDDGEPWYTEHKEALLLLALGGFATLSAFLLRKFK